MAEFRLARLQRTVPIVEAKGLPTAEFQRQYQTTLERIEAAILDLATQLALIAAAQAAAVAAQASATAAAASAATALAEVGIVDERTTSARQFLALD